MAKRDITIPPLDQDLRQHQLEKWEDYYNERAKDVRGRNNVNGLTIRAAVVGGWFLDPNFNEDDVALLTRQQADELVIEIDKLYASVTAVPEKKS